MFVFEIIKILVLFICLLSGMSHYIQANMTFPVKYTAIIDDNYGDFI